MVMPQHASFQTELNKTQQMLQRTRTTLHAMFYFTTSRRIGWDEEPHWHEVPVKKNSL
jgi:hypothetical protein